MSIKEDNEARAMGQEIKQVHYLTANDYETRELWRTVALRFMDTAYSDPEAAITAADKITQAYVNFTNNQENK